MWRVVLIMGCFASLLVGCSDSNSCEGEGCAEEKAEESNKFADAEEETDESIDWSDIPTGCGITGYGREVVALDTTGDSCQSQLELGVSEQGQLESVDGASCEYLGGGVLGPTKAPTCRQVFDCGACEFRLFRMTNERNENFEKWFLFADNDDDDCPSSLFAPFSKACEFYIDPVSESLPDPDSSGGDTGSQCSPACGVTEYCSEGACTCPSGCKQGTVCCGGPFCADDCIGTPCCR